MGITLLAAMSSVVALIYYLRPAALMFIPDRTPAPVPPGARRYTVGLVMVATVGITLLGILPNLIYGYVAHPPAPVTAAASPR